MKTSDDDIQHRVEAFVRARLGHAVDARIGPVSRVAVGRSCENWLFDVEHRDGPGDGWTRERLIARRDPLGGLLETDRVTEFAVLTALGATAVPAPTARWLDPTGAELGRPCLVMSRLPGRCEYRVLDGPAPLPERLGLARRLCQLLVDVHAIDWAGAGLGATFTDPGLDAALAAMGEWEAILQRDQLEAYPELTLAAGWLRVHAPRSPGTVLVHGDFKPGNVLVEDGAIVALLDWELAHLGDPHEDLGWITQPLRTREHFIPGAWERAELLDCYEERSGRRVDHEAVAWWNVFATFKTAVMQVTGLRAFVEGRSDELYQPTSPVLRLLLDTVG